MMILRNIPFVVFLSAFLITGCTKTDAVESEENRVDTALMSNTPPVDSVLYIDVRTKDEFDAGHVEGAIHIPHDQMGNRWQELEQYRNDRIILYCRSGRRSGLAEQILRDKGFVNLENGGGLEGLQSKGVPVTGPF